jgi:hypothetical protein
MVQVVSRRPLTAEARVHARVNPCGICGGQSGTGTGFSLSSSIFPCQHIIPASLSKLISSGEYATVSRHPSLGTRPTPTFRKKNLLLENISVEDSGPVLCCDILRRKRFRVNPTPHKMSNRFIISEAYMYCTSP